MLDIRFIREHPDLVQDGARKKHIEVDIAELLQVDEQRRQLIARVENLKALRNKTSKEIPSLQGDARQARIWRVPSRKSRPPSRT
jgi:seryl-tRNA synthetase